MVVADLGQRLGAIVASEKPVDLQPSAHLVGGIGFFPCTAAASHGRQRSRADRERGEPCWLCWKLFAICSVVKAVNLEDAMYPSSGKVVNCHVETHLKDSQRGQNHHTCYTGW